VAAPETPAEVLADWSAGAAPLLAMPLGALLAQ
jgi:hypothetical protein